LWQDDVAINFLRVVALNFKFVTSLLLNLILNYFKTPLVFVEVLDFVDENGNEVLQLGSIVKLAEKTIRLILSR
jgi:hypothetical protein